MPSLAGWQEIERGSREAEKEERESRRTARTIDTHRRLWAPIAPIAPRGALQRQDSWAWYWSVCSSLFIGATIPLKWW